jgi:hypothetical protein
MTTHRVTRATYRAGWMIVASLFVGCGTTPVDTRADLPAGPPAPSKSQ